MTLDRFCVRCGRVFAASADASLCEECAAAADDARVARTVVAPASRSFPEASLVPAEWLAGDVLLGLYEVKGLLGVGGMASVYRVWHRGWGMELAVKSPLPETLDRGGGEAFAAEAGTWVGLGLHPHVVTCFYVRSLGGIPRVFAELVEGGSLRDWIVGRKLYVGGADDVLARLLDVAIQFAWGLGYAHEQGLVHQDVKPANLLLAPDGVAKVTDFGLASRRVLEVPPGAGGVADVSTVVRGVGGTQAYFSPEQAEAVAQARAGLPVGDRTWLTRRTDVWSWAVSVLEMFAGERRSEFGQVAPEELESYLAAGPVAGIPRMPGGLAELLGECLKADPEQRPHDFARIADRLIAIYQHATGTTYRRRPPEPLDLRADSLNNKALSLLDLGRPAEAEAALAQALVAEPHHLEATYNLGLLRWRDAALTDVDVLQRIEAAGARHPAGSAARLLALVHLERRDPEAAVRALESVPGAMDVSSPEAALLAKARRQRAALAAPTRVLGRHEGAVTSVAVTPDGTRAVSVDEHGELRVWQPLTGQCLRTLEVPGSRLTSVAIADDGRTALTGGGDELLRLWNVDAGTCRTLAGHEYEATAVALSGDGTRAVSGSWDGSLLNWDVAAGSSAGALEGHEDRVTGVALSTAGRVAVSGGGHDDETARSWDLDGGRCLQTFTEANRTVEAVAITGDGRVAVSGSEDSSLWAWEAATGRVLAFMSHPAYVWTVAVTPDGRFAVSGTEDGVVRIWAIPDEVERARLRALDPGDPDDEEWEHYPVGRCLRTMDTGGSEYLRIALAPGAGVLLSGGEDGVLRRWALELGGTARSEYAYCLPRPTSTLAGEAQLVVTALTEAEALAARGESAAAAAVLRDARLLPAYSRDPRLVEAWSRTGLTGRRTGLRDAWPVFQGESVVLFQSVALARDARLALTAERRGRLAVWDLSTGVSRELGGWEEPTSAAWALDGRAALSGHHDGALRLRDVVTDEVIRSFEGHEAEVTSVSTTGDGRFVLSASEDGTLRLWETSTGVCVRVCHHDESAVTAAALSPDGAVAAAGGADGSMWLWDLPRGTPVRKWHLHEDRVCSILVTTDGAGLSAGWDGALHAWELAQVGRSWTLGDGTEEARAVAAAADPRFAVSGGDDGNIRVWRLRTGACLKVLPADGGEIMSLAVTPDGGSLLVGGPEGWDVARSTRRTGRLRLWRLDWDYEFPDRADWEEGARAHLENFLALHTPYAAPVPTGRPPTEEETRRALTRLGPATWTEDDFAALLVNLRYAGYGWLRPDGVLRALQALAGGRGQ